MKGGALGLATVQRRIDTNGCGNTLLSAIGRRSRKPSLWVRAVPHCYVIRNGPDIGVHVALTSRITLCAGVTQTPGVRCRVNDSVERNRRRMSRTTVRVAEKSRRESLWVAIAILADVGQFPPESLGRQWVERVIAADREGDLVWPTPRKEERRRDRQCKQSTL